MAHPNLDAVALMRHQHQFRLGMANRPAVDARKSFLDYGEPEAFPPHALVPNPSGQPLCAEWRRAIGAWPLDALEPAAEYRPGELIMWIDTDGGMDPQ